MGPPSLYRNASNMLRWMEKQNASINADFPGASQHTFFPRIFKVRFVFPPFALAFAGTRWIRNEKHAGNSGTAPSVLSSHRALSKANVLEGASLREKPLRRVCMPANTCKCKHTIVMCPGPWKQHALSYVLFSICFL